MTGYSNMHAVSFDLQTCDWIYQKCINKNEKCSSHMVKVKKLLSCKCCKQYKLQHQCILDCLSTKTVVIMYASNFDENWRLPTQLGVLCLFQDGSGLLPEVICPTLNVLGATYANCDGRYKVTGERVDWSPDRPVYKHVNKDRYIFWNAGGLGWSIGKKAYLKTGSHWHRSKLNISKIN